MVDVTSGPLFGNSGFQDFTVVELPNVVRGRLADLIAAVSAPGLPDELVGEDRARSMFESASATWPKRGHLRRPVRAAVVAASVASLFATTTALAAASDLPAPAARVVDGAFHQVGISVGPQVPAPSQSAGVTPAPPAVGHSGNMAVAAHPAAAHRSAPGAAVCHSRPGSGNSAVGQVTSGSVSCGTTKATKAHHRGTRVSTELEKYRKLAQEAAADARQDAHKTTGSTTPTGPLGNRGGNQGAGSGRGGKGIGNRGGNQGAGSGKGTTGKKGRGKHGSRKHRRHHGLAVQVNGPNAGT
jgi:hypothetical protein